jgi:copper chaperone CopZ
MEARNTKKDSYRIEGMTCSGCERTVSKVVANIQGVKSAKADLSSSSVFVEYDPTQVDVEKIKSAVNSVGYKFVEQKSSDG